MYEGRTMRRMAELFTARGELKRARDFAAGAVAILETSEDVWAKDRAVATLRSIDDVISNSTQV